jgi:hypothetical protein
MNVPGSILASPMVFPCELPRANALTLATTTEGDISSLSLPCYSP